jgi:hypothetical protein
VRGRSKPVVFPGAIPLTLALFIMLLVTPLPPEGRIVVVVLLLTGWCVAGVRWLYRRFGQKGIIALAILCSILAGSGGYAYWRDEPNRQLVSQVKQLHAHYVGTNGTYLTGQIDYVYFDEKATDEDVRKFTELKGLDCLDRLVFKGTQITDLTTRKLGQFPQLRFLYIEGARINDETIDHLERALPDCEIEVK